MLRLENWQNVGFGENGVIADLDSPRESFWLYHKDRSLRKVTGDKITLQKTVAFLGMKKSEGEKKKKMKP